MREGVLVNGDVIGVDERLVEGKEVGQREK